jgi:hypothetical protein
VIFRKIRRSLAPGLVVISILASACTGAGGASGGTANGTAGAAPVRELTSIRTLEEAFNDDTGKVRVVLLLSPT